jgi:hypothetical protein
VRTADPTARRGRLSTYATPDFLLVLVAPANFMGLSLFQAAHAVVSNAAWQEILERPVEKHPQEGSAEPQVPPLRFAPVGMTRGGQRFRREWIPDRGVFHCLGWDAGPWLLRSSLWFP